MMAGSAKAGDRARAVAGCALVMGIAAACAAGCRTSYPAPQPGAPAEPLPPSSRGAATEGDIEGIEQAERACRRSLRTRTVAASLRAIDAATEQLGRVCTIEPVDDDPLLWRVWCRADALFQPGHYLRSADEPFECGDDDTASAFECAGRILAGRLLEPGHAKRVELVGVGHVDRQRIASDGEFVADPCVELQRELDVPRGERWEAPEQEPPDEQLPTWNERLSWCRAAYGASETLRGLVEGSDTSVEVDAAAVGAGTQWLDARRRCPVRRRRSEPRGACTPARRVDVLLRFVPVERAAGSTCKAPGELADAPAARALYCYEDCVVTRETGRVRQRYEPRGGAAPQLFGGAAEAPEPWIIHAIRGERAGGVNLSAVERIVGIDEQ